MRETKLYSSRKIYLNAFLFLLFAGVFLYFILLTPRSENQVVQPNFSQALPVVVIDTQGASIDSTPDYRDVLINDTIISLQENTQRYNANLSLYQKDPYEDNFKVKPILESDITMNTRGQSSQYYPKKQYTIRLIDDNGFKNPQEILGMAKHDKWVLNGMYSDKTLMRNKLVYQMGDQIMDFSPKTKYVEVYLKTNEDQSKEEQYQGTYLLTEKISRDKNRVNILKNDSKYPDTSFIMARDKIKADDLILQSDWSKLEEAYYSVGNDHVRMRTVMTVSYPNKDDITQEQEAAIIKSINDFEYALKSKDFKDPRKGYRNYIDADSFIKFAMINEITKNIDGGEVSYYFYKDIGSKIKAGPIWDFDMSLGNTASSEVNRPTGFLMLDRIWYERLFQDEYFAQRYENMYKSYRRSIWSNENINLMIDQTLLNLEESIDGNNQKWFPNETSEDYRKEVENLRKFLLTRLEWMDDNIELVKRVTQS